MSAKLERWEEAKRAILERVEPRAVLEEAGIRLHRSGRTFVICCLWHDDSTPSCAVYDNRLFCYACRGPDRGPMKGKGWNVFDTWMRLHGGDFADAVRALAPRVGCDLETGAVTTPPPRRPSPAPTPARPERSLPPRSEVAALWAQCVRVDTDPEVSAWLASRGFNASEVADLDLCRALPRDTDCPPWAGFAKGGRWSRSPWRAIFPTWTPDGRLASLRARAVVELRPRAGQKKPPPKTVAPLDCPTAGHVLADALALDVLRRGGLPDDWPPGERLALAIVEGETDFMVWPIEGAFGDASADTCTADKRAPAVLGLWSGAWTPELAARIPDGSLVVVRTDNDRAGDAYADAINRSLGHRCDVRRGGKRR